MTLETHLKAVPDPDGVSGPTPVVKPERMTLTVYPLTIAPLKEPTLDDLLLPPTPALIQRSHLITGSLLAPYFSRAIRYKPQELDIAAVCYSRKLSATEIPILRKNPYEQSSRPLFYPVLGDHLLLALRADREFFRGKLVVDADSVLEVSLQGKMVRAIPYVNGKSLKRDLSYGFGLLLERLDHIWTEDTWFLHLLAPNPRRPPLSPLTGPELVGMPE